MKATLRQIAWYIERDGARVVRYDANGDQLVRVPALAGHIDWPVPFADVDELNRERDLVYARLQAKRRTAGVR